MHPEQKKLAHQEASFIYISKFLDLDVGASGMNVSSRF